MKYYVVSCIKRDCEVSTSFGHSKLELSFADGMCGVMPVFTNKKKAKRFAGNGVKIMEFAPKLPTTDRTAK
jgi:hypothetical protein